MKTKKRRFEQFTLSDYEAVEDHLSKMAAKGWLLESMGQYWWTYCRAEPQKLTFSVTYFPEASSFNPAPSEEQWVFYDYCAAAGWRFVAEWHQMQVFCTDQENPLPLETDEAVKLNTIHEAMKRNFLPSHLILLGLAALQMFLQFNSFRMDPISYLAGPASLFGAGIWLLLAIFLIFILADYSLWYHRSRRAVEAGGTCLHRRFSLRKAGTVFLLLFCLAAFVLVTVAIDARFRLWVMGITFCTVALGTALALGIKNGLKWAGVPGKKGLLLTILLSLVGIVIVTTIVFSGFIGVLRSGVLDEPPAETYTLTMPNGTTHTWEIYRDTLPLTVEMLDGGVAYEHYSTQREDRSSIFVDYLSARQDSLPDGQDAPELYYELVKVKWPFLYDACRASYLDRYQTVSEELYEYEPRRLLRTDEEAWQAREVYQVYYNDEPWGQYIVCWEDAILFLRYDDPLTQAQIQTVRNKVT